MTHEQTTTAQQPVPGHTHDHAPVHPPTPGPDAPPPTASKEANTTTGRNGVATGIDPRVADWAARTLENASNDLEQAEDLTAAITRHAQALAVDRKITDPDLITQIVSACHAAIALVYVTDYQRNVVDDPCDAAEPGKTITAVARLFADHPRELRWHLAHTAAVKIQLFSATYGIETTR